MYHKNIEAAKREHKRAGLVLYTYNGSPEIGCRAVPPQFVIPIRQRHQHTAIAHADRCRCPPKTLEPHAVKFAMMRCTIGIIFATARRQKSQTALVGGCYTVGIKCPTRQCFQRNACIVPASEVPCQIRPIVGCGHMPTFRSQPPRCHSWPIIKMTILAAVRQIIVVAAIDRSAACTAPHLVEYNGRAVVECGGIQWSNHPSALSYLQRAIHITIAVYRDRKILFVFARYQRQQKKQAQNTE